MAVGTSSSEPVGAVPGPAALTARLMSAWQEGSLEGLREIIHPDAVFETTTHRRDGVVQGREAILASLMDYRDSRYPIRVERVAETSQTSGVVYAFARMPLDDKGGFTEGPVTWEITLRDGLLWRTVIH
jgi:ketosteroid isomerase-like protein